ncbi:MAG: hypothetical protein ACFE7R_07775 [Candidatus Hodarchaeota archaeon]
MSKKKGSKLAARKKYTVKQLLNDVKKLDCTPSVLDTVGREIVYYEWSCANDQLGYDHPVTTSLSSLLEFMRGGYEKRLVEGELCRIKDTPSSAINEAVRGAPEEFLSYELLRPGDHIKWVLETVAKERINEKKQYKKIKKYVKNEIKGNPENPDLWNKLRILLWILGDYKGASEAFKEAKKLGWDVESSSIVAV